MANYPLSLYVYAHSFAYCLFPSLASLNSLDIEPIPARESSGALRTFRISKRRLGRLLGRHMREAGLSDLPVVLRDTNAHIYNIGLSNG